MVKLNTITAKHAKSENDIDRAIADYLTRRHINYAASYIGETMRDNHWQCDEWRVNFERTGVAVPIRESFYTGTGHRRESMHYGGGTLAVIPTAANVLYSLTLDDPQGEPFEIWADNFGFNSDSRKAYAVWNECNRIGSELTRFFSAEELEHIRKTLTDY